MDTTLAEFGVAQRVLRTTPYGFLVTSSRGCPRARLVQHLLVDEDCSVWLATSPDSRKVADIRTSSGPALYAVEDRDAFAYVTVSGEPSLIHDETRRSELWDEGLRAFFPGGPLGDDFVLVHMAAQRVEVMSFADAIHPDPYGLAARTFERSGERWRSGTSRDPTSQ